MLNDPIQLIGPASLVGNSRETFHKSGTDGSNPSSRESCELAISRRIADCLSRSRTDTLPIHIAEDARARAAATLISPAHSADSGMACRIGNVRKAGTVPIRYIARQAPGPVDMVLALMAVAPVTRDEPIYGWFTEGFATPDLKEAKALLDELT